MHALCQFLVLGAVVRCTSAAPVLSHLSRNRRTSEPLSAFVSPTSLSAFSSLAVRQCQWGARGGDGGGSRFRLPASQFRLPRIHQRTSCSPIMSWRVPKGMSVHTDNTAKDIDPGMLSRYGIRLASVASMVPRSSRVADIGCDHGHLSIGLINSGIASRVIASEKNELPLSLARKHIAEEGGLAQSLIELRKGDGLQVIKPGEIDAAAICGMGGPLIAKILFGSSLERDDDVPLPGQRPASPPPPGSSLTANDLEIKSLIMQPTGPIVPLRHALYANGWEITREALTCDGKWAHVVIAASPVAPGTVIGSRMESDEDVLLGPFLKHETSQVYMLWIKKQMQHYEAKLRGMELKNGPGGGGAEAERVRRCLAVLGDALGKFRV